MCCVEVVDHEVQRDRGLGFAVADGQVCATSEFENRNAGKTRHTSHADSGVEVGENADVSSDERHVSDSKRRSLVTA